LYLKVSTILHRQIRLKVSDASDSGHPG